MRYTRWRIWQVRLDHDRFVAYMASRRRKFVPPESSHMNRRLWVESAISPPEAYGAVGQFRLCDTSWGLMDSVLAPIARRPSAQFETIGKSLL